MNLARRGLLWISENRTLRETLPRYGFVKRAVKRFMPGEELGDAIAAAEMLRAKSIPAIFTRLGENIADPKEADQTTNHYCEALQEIDRRGIDAYVSVKLTQLGLDLDGDLCYRNLESIVRTADKLENWVWIDMEQSGYVDRTLKIYRRIRSSFAKVGVCLQAYLYRTEKDLQDLLPMAPAIRLVKGAYKEPMDMAFPRKSDVDANYFRLSQLLLQNIPKGVVFGVATHDKSLIGRVSWEAERLGIAKDQYEYQLLYGIQEAEQERLAREGFRIRCLISYGSYWFPWYVRRLAERPANVMFVVKNLFG